MITTLSNQHKDKSFRSSSWEEQLPPHLILSFWLILTIYGTMSLALASWVWCPECMIGCVFKMTLITLIIKAEHDNDEQLRWQGCHIIQLHPPFRARCVSYTFIPFNHSVIVAVAVAVYIVTLFISATKWIIRASIMNKPNHCMSQMTYGNMCTSLIRPVTASSSNH